MLESLKNIFLPQKWGQLPADRGAADTAKTPKNCFTEEQIEVHVQRKWLSSRLSNDYNYCFIPY